MQFVVIAQHAPQLCPTSNAAIRQLFRETVRDIPRLAQKMGVKIVAMNIYGPGHQLFGVLEAGGMEAVQSLVVQSRLAQWNTVAIHPTWSLEEALAQADALPALF